MKIDYFFAELKRRNVYKVAVAYVVVAWLPHPGGLHFPAGFRRAFLGDEGLGGRHPFRISGRGLGNMGSHPEGVLLKSALATNIAK